MKGSLFIFGITPEQHFFFKYLRGSKRALPLSYQPPSLRILGIFMTRTNPYANLLGPATPIVSALQILSSMFLMTCIRVEQRTGWPGIEQKRAELRLVSEGRQSREEKNVTVELKAETKESRALAGLSAQQPPQIYTIRYLKKSDLKQLGWSLSYALRTTPSQWSLMKSLLYVPLKYRQVYSGFFSTMLEMTWLIFHGTSSLSLVWNMLQGIACSLPTVLFFTYLFTMWQVIVSLWTKPLGINCRQSLMLDGIWSTRSNIQAITTPTVSNNIFKLSIQSGEILTHYTSIQISSQIYSLFRFTLSLFTPSSSTLSSTLSHSVLHLYFERILTSPTDFFTCLCFTNRRSTPTP